MVIGEHVARGAVILAMAALGCATVQLIMAARADAGGIRAAHLLAVPPAGLVAAALVGAVAGAGAWRSLECLSLGRPWIVVVGLMLLVPSTLIVGARS